MDIHRNMTDEELRRQLKVHGISSPVTASTRDILIKKLNNAISTAKKTDKSYKLTQPTYSNDTKSMKERTTSSLSNRKYPSLHSFSSDEEESTDYPSTSTQLRRSSRNSSLDGSYIAESNIRKKATKTLNGSRKPLQTIEFNSDSESEETISYTPLVLHHRSTASQKRSPVVQDQNDSYSDSDSEIPEDCEDSCKDKTKQIEDPCSSKFYKNFKIFDTEHDKRKVPVVSSVKNNAQRGTELRIFHNRFQFLNKIQSPNDVVTQDRPTNLVISNGVTQQEQQPDLYNGGSWLQFVPILLLAVFGVFFMSLGVVYLNIHKSFLNSSQDFPYLPFVKTSTNAPLGLQEMETTAEMRMSIFTQADSRNKFPSCKDEVSRDCLSKDEMSEVPSILAVMEEILKPALVKQASSYQCGNSEHYYLSKDQISQLILTALPSIPVSAVSDGVAGIGKLLLLNPHWGLESVWSQTQVYPPQHQLIGFAVSYRPREILCYASYALKNAATIAGLILAGCLLLWSLYRFIRMQKEKNEDIEHNAYELVEKILEILEKSCGADGKEFLAVNHVRDCLIAPRERQIKSKIWERAVTFIDEHDSRVHREVRLVGGEDTEVWRWVSGAPRSPSPSPALSLGPISNSGDNSWQGKAFEASDARNIPIASPTSCLKIRKMFDPSTEYGEDWPRRIQDDLLDKCASANIVHVAVDQSSKEGCVYFKCSTPTDAGYAFRALHGTWYNGNLVTVKYLRDERYHERFPTARHLSVPLRNAKLRRRNRRPANS